MLVLEFKVLAQKYQYTAIDEAIRTAQFIQNKCLRFWMDNSKVNKYDLNKYCRVLAYNKDFAVKLARCVVHSNDVIAYEDLRIKNLVKKRCYLAASQAAKERAPRDHCLARSINDAAWYQFRLWLEYFGKKHGKITIAVPPQFTSQNCSNCGEKVKKSLSTRTHICTCGCQLDRDENAARTILKLGLGTVGHSGTGLQDSLNAWGESTSTFSGEILSEQVGSMNQESPITA
jgi:putative transposase